MADVKWIKIVTDIFDDEKILLIESMPDKYAIIVCWFKLLCLAGKQNNSGVFMLNDRIAYTDEMMATIFRMPLATVRMSLQTFEQFGMVEIVDGVITIPNWGRHQSLDAYEKKKAYDRQYRMAQREKQKLLAEKTNDCQTTSRTMVVVPEEDREEDKEKEVDKKTECQQVVDLYHAICKSFPKIRSLSDARKKAIKARLKTYSLEDFKAVFEKAESSSFLKGEDKDWSATFDWLIKEANFLKVLEGNYADKRKRKEVVPGWMNKPRELDEGELEAIKRMMAEPDDPELEEEMQRKRQAVQDRAEKLRQSLQGD